MNKKFLILGIILLILVTILTTMGIFFFLSKSKAKIVETKTFSEIPGFIFEYPVFEGWEPDKTDITKNNETGDLTATIFFSNPTKILFEIGPRMTVVKSARTVKISEESVDRNPNGVAYSHVKETSSSPERITFFLPDSTVDILPFMHEGDGYSGKVITQKIIDSFKYDGQAGEAAGTKTFSEIPGFTFKYPEFSGWEASLVNKVSDNNYEILLKDSNPNRAKVSEQYQPKIMVVKKDYAPGSSGIVDRPIGVPVMVNSNKVSYVYAKEELSGGDYTPSHYGYAIFYGKFMVWVQLDNLSEKAGFPADQFFKTVIDSFKFTDKITLEQAEILAKDFMLKQSGADILLRPEKTQERKFGYVFFFANKEYIETGNVSKLIPGIGPVAVEYSGKVVSISSSVDSAKAIDDYEQQWAQNN